LFLFTLLFGIILLPFILFSKISIEIIWKREHGNDRGEIKFKALWGLIRFRYKIPKIDFVNLTEGIQWEQEGPTGEKEVQFNWEKVQQLKEIYRQFKDQIDIIQKYFRLFLQKVTCSHFEWSTSFGTGDAAESGVLTGVIWGVKSTLVGMISGMLRWKQPPRLSVVPYFNQRLLQTYFHSIISFRVGHAIVILFQILREVRQRRERLWQGNTLFKA
jgi:hypothetical protein